MLELLKWALKRSHWNDNELNEAREKFRAGLISEWKFRGTLRRLGYTQYGIDREVEDQITRMTA